MPWYLFRYIHRDTCTRRIPSFDHRVVGITVTAVIGLLFAVHLDAVRTHTIGTGLGARLDAVIGIVHAPYSPVVTTV